MDTGIKILIWLGLGHLIVEVSRSHPDTPHSVWLPWKSDQPVVDASTWQHQHNRMTSMPTAGFEFAIPARERPQTQALECAAAGIGGYWELGRFHPFTGPGKDRVPILQEAGWTPEPVWTGAENLIPTGIRSTVHPAHSQSLYLLSYPAGIGNYSQLILPVLQTWCRVPVYIYGIGQWQAACRALNRNCTVIMCVTQPAVLVLRYCQVRKCKKCGYHVDIMRHRKMANTLMWFTRRILKRDTLRTSNFRITFYSL
jgi:hypothetical protein